MWIGDDVAAGLGQRLVAGEEVADRGLRGRGQVGGLAQPGVELVEVVLVLGPVIAVPADVEADLLDSPALDQLGGR